ncbi:MAG TPA: SulP family inorganic anion transporter [Thermoanaerobaculia bacterium]|nr:SulP family inorganic anion transporter [Thermoanaerobaculia bacterium]
MRGGWLPKTFTTLRGYTVAQLVSDLQAGVIVGIVAIPLALAFAIASGVPPERGLVTAVVAGFLISLLGGSRVQIGGPTGAFVVIVSGIVARYGLDGLTICTVLAGILLVAMGLARFGGAIKFIPYPVVTGFTSGIAIIIFSSQVKDLLGLTLGPVPGPFIAKWGALGQAFATVSVPAVGVSLGSLLILVAWPRVSRRIPAPIVAILAASAAVAVFGIPVETLGSRFGEIHAAIPAPKLPDITLERVRELFSPALTVALLAAIESLLSAVVADGMIGSRHKSNVELVGQGIANIASGLFGGMPATGAIARTATNVKNGGRTPVAGMAHAVTVLLVLVFLGKWARYIPMATLAAILTIVSYHMSEWRSFANLFKTPGGDVAVLLTTFLLTVLIDLTVAVQVGVVLAAFLFIKRMADVTNVGAVTRELTDAPDGTMNADVDGVARRRIPDGVEVYEVTGAFFFGAADKIKEVLQFVARKPKVFILRMRNVPIMDASGLRVLDDLFESFARQGIRFVIAGIQEQPLAALVRAGKLEEYGRDNFVASLDDALATARRHIGAGEEGPR